MYNWKVGDKARVIYVRNQLDTLWKPGIVVTIISLEYGFTPMGNPYDCEVKLSNGVVSAQPLFEQLEPIVPDSSSWSKIEEITNWNPSKEKVV